MMNFQKHFPKDARGKYPMSRLGVSLFGVVIA